MDNSTALIWLSGIEGLNGKPLERLLEAFPEPEALWEEPLQARPLLSARMLRALCDARSEALVDELLAGLEEKGVRALTLLGRTSAEAIVLSAYDSDCALLALVENLQREDLHYLDEAEAYRSILDRSAVTQEHLAKALCLSPSALANRLRLLKLPDAVREALRASGLSERHARALLRLSDADQQLELVRDCAARHLSVKQLESRIDRLRQAAPRPKVSRVIRDNRIIINAVLDTVKELNRIGVRAESRVEERSDSVEVIVRIPIAAPET